MDKLGNFCRGIPSLIAMQATLPGVKHSSFGGANHPGEPRLRWLHLIAEAPTFTIDTAAQFLCHLPHIWHRHNPLLRSPGPRRSFWLLLAISSQHTLHSSTALMQSIWDYAGSRHGPKPPISAVMNLAK